MPTSTFLNLPAAKREALVVTAVDEFAEHDFASASVSRIVATLGIAKGSVYQYFADKQDLYGYLVEHCQRVLLGVVTEGPRAVDPNFFAVLRHLMERTVLAAQRWPREAALLERAYRDPAALPTELRVRTGAERHNYVHGLVQQAQSRGEVAPDADPELVTLVVESVITQIGPRLDALLPQGGAERYDDAATRQVFDQAIDLLRHGLGAPRS